MLTLPRGQAREDWVRSMPVSVLFSCISLGKTSFFNIFLSFSVIKFLILLLQDLIMGNLWLLKFNLN